MEEEQDYQLALHYFQQEFYSKAFDLFLKIAAEHNMTQSQHQVGYCYHCGLGVEKNYSKAMEYYLKSAEKNFSDSQFFIGILFNNGRGIEKDYSKAMEWYLKAAENGHSKAMCNLAALYENGFGVSQDYSKAMEWYLKSSELGNSIAQCNIASMFANGKGVDQDYSKSFEWYLKAAENGDSTAQSFVASAFATGRGVNRDYSKAFEWYLKLVESNDNPSNSFYNIHINGIDRKTSINAKCNLASLYENGLGVKKDMSKAFEWYLKAAHDGHPNAQFKVAEFHRAGVIVQQDFSKAVEWYLIAANNGHVEAQFNAAYAFEEGIGVLQQDYAKSMELYSLAAQQGSAAAECNIGNMYLDGRGVVQDLVKAEEHLVRAAERGDVLSQVNIAYYYMNGVFSLDYAKAFKWYQEAAKRGHKIAQNNLATLLELGLGIEKNLKQALFWKSKSLNSSCKFHFVEEPYEKFALNIFKPQEETEKIQSDSNELVIIRFKTRDFTILKSKLITSKYFTTMMNSNWINGNEKENDQFVMDFRPIENEMFHSNTNHVIEIFEKYIEYLTNDTIPISFDTKMELIELSRYLQDDSCIFKIVKDSDILTRFYILSHFDKTVQLDIPIVSCYIMDPLFEMGDISPPAIEKLLSGPSLSPIATSKILDKVSLHNYREKTDMDDDNNIIHVIFSPTDMKKEIQINKETVIIEMECLDNSVTSIKRYSDLFTIK